MARILAVPGIERTGAEFRRELWNMAERNGWDVDAIATVMSIESGFDAAIKNPQAGQTASGLIQMIDATAKSLGIAGGAAELRTMSDVEQLPYVEEYYRRAHLGPSARRVDFYLAGWGSGIGAGMGTVLARAGEKKYKLNSGLDRNGDGTITVGDLDAFMATQQAKAGGLSVEVDPFAGEGELGDPLPGQPMGPAVGPALGGGSSLSVRRSQSLQRLCEALPVLRVGDADSVVNVVRYLLNEPVTGRLGEVRPVYSPNLAIAVRLFQQRKRLVVDAIIGPKTWRALLEALS